MRTLAPKTLVRVGKVYDDEIEVAGQKLWVDRSFENKNWHRFIYGEVLSSGYVPEGTRVYFHYLQTDSNEVEKGVFVMDNEMLFCYVDADGIHMLGEYTLIKPIPKQQTSSIIVTLDPGFEKDKGILVHQGDNDLGVPNNAVVILNPNCNFKNEIEGEEYWVVRYDDIIAYEHGAEALGTYGNTNQ